MPDAKRRKPDLGADPKHALVQAAAEIVEEAGLPALSGADLEARLGVPGGTLEKHFRTREALMAAVAIDGFRRLRDELKEAVARSGEDPLDQWEAIGIAYVRFAVSHTGYFRIMYCSDLSNHEPFPALDKAAREAFRLLMDAVAASQAARRVPQGDGRELAFISWATMHGVAELLLNRQFARMSNRGIQAEAAALAASRTLRFGLEEGRPEPPPRPSRSGSRS